MARINNSASSTQKLSGNHIVEAIKLNDKEVLKSLYKNNYHKIEALVLKNKGTKEQAKDIYQEAFIAVWKNVRMDKFVPENDSAINGYLYTIAKNKWLDYLRSSPYRKVTSYHESINVVVNNVAEDQHEIDSDHEEKLSLVMEAFKGMGDSCKSLLSKFYFEKKSMKEIAKELKLDAASARNKKYRCMQSLRELTSRLNNNNERAIDITERI